MNTETISVSSGTSSSRSTNKISCSANASSNSVWPHPLARRSTFSCFARKSRSSTIMILACLTRVKQVSSSVSKDPREAARAPRFSCSPNTFLAWDKAGPGPRTGRHGRRREHPPLVAAFGRRSGYDSRMRSCFSRQVVLSWFAKKFFPPSPRCDRHLGPFSRLNDVYQGVARRIPANRRGDQSLCDRTQTA